MYLLPRRFFLLLFLLLRLWHPLLQQLPMLVFFLPSHCVEDFEAGLAVVVVAVLTVDRRGRASANSAYLIGVMMMMMMMESEGG